MCIYDVYVNLIHHYPMELFRANTNKLKHCKQKEVLETQLAGGRSIGYKQSTANELRLGQPRTKPVNNRLEPSITRLPPQSPNNQ